MTLGLLLINDLKNLFTNPVDNFVHILMITAFNPHKYYYSVKLTNFFASPLILKPKYRKRYPRRLPASRLQRCGCQSPGAIPEPRQLMP